MTSSISEEKYCAKCVHLRGRRLDTAESERWECFKSESKVDLVSGLKRYIKCSDVRASSIQCGPTGAWYEEYVQPVRQSTEYFQPSPTIGGKFATELTTEEVFDKATLASNANAAAERLAALKAKKKL